MNLIDAQYTATPFYGIRRMTAWLATQGEMVNHKRVARLMRVMGIETIYTRPKTSLPADNVRRYPYLLKGMRIEEPNQALNYRTPEVVYWEMRSLLKKLE